MADAPPAPALRPATDLAAPRFEREVVPMVELYRAALRAGVREIAGRRFSGCIIEGPAVLLLAGGVVLNDCDLGDAHGELDSLLLRPASPTRATGVLPVLDCRFEQCGFVAIGFTGSESTLDMLRRITEPPGGA